MDQDNVAELFISHSFDEVLVEATALKKALVDRGRTVFLCADPPGLDSLEAVANNLDKAKLVIIMGSKT